MKCKRIIADKGIRDKDCGSPNGWRVKGEIIVETYPAKQHGGQELYVSTKAKALTT